MIYELKRLLEFDLNNPKEIKIDDIADSILHANDFSNTIDKVFAKLNKKRHAQVNKKVFSNLNENLLKIRDKKVPIIKFSKNICNDELSEKLVNEFELSIPELEYYIQSFSDLQKTVKEMLLPITDNNAEEAKKKEQFYNHKLDLVVLLRRMGKIAEADMLIDFEYSKVYSFSSYVKEWKITQKEIMKNNENIRNIKIDTILSSIIDKVKDAQSEREKQSNAFLKLAPAKKLYKKYENAYKILQVLDLDT